MRAAGIVPSLAYASHTLVDPGEHLEKLIGKAFMPLAAPPNRASHMSVHPGVRSAFVDREPVEHFPIGNREKSVAHLRGEVLKLEEIAHRTKPGLEAFQPWMAVMKRPQAYPTQINVQNWSNMIYGFGCLGYGIGAAVLLSILYKFFFKWNCRAPVVRGRPPDGAELQSSAVADGGHRTADVVMKEGQSFVLGLNKYSHDAGACLLSTDGHRSLIVPNERLSRIKHDGGDTAAAVRHALEAVGASLDDVVAVCANNHHHRVAPFEARLPWAVPMGLYDSSTLLPENLFPGVPTFELSHHLAHAWSAITQAPFERGLVVIMDGMGETYAAMQAGLDTSDKSYMHDLRLPMAKNHIVVPPTSSGALGTPPGHREAETAYCFAGNEIHRVFKRWVPQRSPSELYNHGFENLESIGALYSRVSSHIFGDWNACGKVMGLAPWADEWVGESDAEQRILSSPLLRGDIGGVSGGGSEPVTIEWPTLETLPLKPNGFTALQRETGDAIMVGKEGGHEKHEAQGSGGSMHSLTPERQRQRGMYTALAKRVQEDLEEITLRWLRSLQATTGETNLIFIGGVAQNSVLNGRIAREAGFDNVFIPPYPGDEGIAAGCAAYAQQVLLPELGMPAPKARREPWSAYQGREYNAEEVREALDEFAPWIAEVFEEAEAGMEDEAKAHANDIEADLKAELEAELQAEMGRAASANSNFCSSIGGGNGNLAKIGGDETVSSWDVPSDAVVQLAAAALARGEIVGWVHGPAEVGARALGHRSILANPSLSEMHQMVNVVKQREQWRPLAPSVLAEEANDWFEGLPPSGSSYMQITASVRDEVREKVPSITHVDGSARLQTVREDESPVYHALIAAFFALTGVPMVMNTSFNLAGMPIVESPRDALACFLDADDAFSLLVLHGHVLRRRAFPMNDTLSAAVPRQERAFVGRYLSDATGEPLRAEVLVDGVWIELTDNFELEVLERCAHADKTVAVISTEIAIESEGSISEADVVERLRHLFRLRLISMD